MVTRVMLDVEAVGRAACRWLFPVLVIATCVLAHAAMIDIDPVKVPTSPGTNFALDLVVANITDLYSVQFDVTFDPTVVSAVNIVEGSLLPSGGPTFFIPGTIDNGAGTITLTADTLIGTVAGVSGSGTLAEIVFTALNSGTSTIGLSNVVLLDSNSPPDEIPAVATNGTILVTPNAVPEPTAMILIGSGLFVMAIRRVWAR